MGLVSSLFDVASAQDVLFHQLQQLHSTFLHTMQAQRSAWRAIIDAYKTVT